MRDDIATQIQDKIHILYTILDNWHSDNVRTRRWNPLGAVISTVTGLATKDDLDPEDIC